MNRFTSVIPAERRREGDRLIRFVRSADQSRVELLLATGLILPRSYVKRMAQFCPVSGCLRPSTPPYAHVRKIEACASDRGGAEGPSKFLPPASPRNPS